MIAVLRLGHRIMRDKRISTHLGLVARAFGADVIYYSGEKDESLLASIDSVSKRWGGGFRTEYRKNWREVVREWPGQVCHLTMYGLPVDDCAKELRECKDLLVVVGGAKVPGDLYETADFNVSVSTQPHSEVSALSILLDRVFEGKELKKEFGGDIQVIPCKKGKNVKMKEGVGDVPE
jgi:tRNA (cytidine56-2'-O)-methyltransferase